MKQAIFLLLLVTLSQCDRVSDMLPKINDIINAMGLEDIIESSTAHKIGATAFKYYYDDFLPLQFRLWKEHVGRDYESDEEHKFRLEVWADNVKYIDQHNKLNKSYTLAMNHFGDMTSKEYRETMLGMHINLTGKMPVGDVDVGDVDDLSRPVDWRTKGYVTPVKNQGQCGSCWAFSSTGAMEGANMARQGKLVSLSEQNLIDCSSSYGNDGCNGGFMDYAFRYVMANGGLDSETSYPYEAVEGECRFNANNTAVRLTGYSSVPKGSERALQRAVASIGPVSIAIDASQPSFQFYRNGVYDEPECSSIQLDHGVLTVGYGAEAGKDYWLVKNSWGTIWGESGYVKMSRNKSNQCGIASSASYPIAG